MPPPPIRADISQPLYIFPQFSPQLVFYLHTRKLGGDVEHVLRVEGAQPRGGVDVQPGEQVSADLRSDAVETLNGLLGYGLEA